MGSALAPIKKTPHHVKLPLRARRARAEHGPASSLAYFRLGVHKDIQLSVLSLHFPVCGRVHDHASVDYPGIHHRSILRYGHRPVSESRTVSLVTPLSILCGDALMAWLALLYAHVWHIVPLMGMLCENATLGISMSLGYVLSKIECVVSSPCYCLHV
jgi:hypothetical protein